MSITRELLLKLPKTDLHVHPSGSMRVQTVIELAEKYNIQIPSHQPDEMKTYLVKKGCPDLVDYLTAFDIPTSVMQMHEGVYRSIYEVCEDAHRENVRYIELRVAPIIYTRGELCETDVVDICLDAMDQAERDFGIKTGLIISALRHMDPQETLKTAQLAVMYKGHGVVGFDLAGAERNFPAKYHLKAFQLVLNNNINCTIHAGEAYGPKSISQAIHYAGAHRLGHASHLIEDGDLLNYVNDQRIPLEICLTSNVDTNAVSELQYHPFKYFYDYGLRVTLNTDNRTVSDTTVTDDYFVAAKIFHLTMKDVKQIIINGFKSTFQPYTQKVKMLNEILVDLSDY